MVRSWKAIYPRNEHDLISFWLAFVLIFSLIFNIFSGILLVQFVRFYLSVLSLVFGVHGIQRAHYLQFGFIHIMRTSRGLELWKMENYLLKWIDMKNIETNRKYRNKWKISKQMDARKLIFEPLDVQHTYRVQSLCAMLQRTVYIKCTQNILSFSLFSYTSPIYFFFFFQIHCLKRKVAPEEI